jgi:hypothetical protein
MDPDKAEAQRIRALLEELEADRPVDSDDSGEGALAKSIMTLSQNLKEDINEVKEAEKIMKMFFLKRWHHEKKNNSFLLCEN